MQKHAHDRSGRGERRARQVVIAAVVLTVLLYVVPYGQLIGYPLMLLSTFAHEMGHGVAALAAGGDFLSFQIFADGSGVALTAGSFGALGRALVSAGGLVGPAVLAALFFLLASGPRLARLGVLLFGTALLVACVLVVRGAFGWAFVGGIGALCLVVAVKGSALFSQGLTAFFACQLALSVFSRGDYLFTDRAVTGAGTQPSDVAHIAEALILPYWFWGAACGLFSVLVLGAGLTLFWRATRPPGDELSMGPRDR